MVLMARLFSIILLSAFVVYAQNYSFFYDNILCFKKPNNLLSQGLLNGKIFYYYGDVKIIELGHRIQFLIDNFDRIDLKTTKYMQKGFINYHNNPYSSFYHPHFLIELKNNIDNFNSFYLNFQMSTNSFLGFEKLSNTTLNMTKDKNQFISPYLRVYATNMVELKSCDYANADRFVLENQKNIKDYVFKNLKDYTPNFKILKM